LYRATVSINGNAVFDATPNANAGKCAPVGTDPASGALMWDFQQPCPKTQRIVIPVDTTSLKDGEHELKVTLLSAAQNASTVLTQTITTDNRTTISGDLTSDPPAAPPPPEPVYTIDLDPPTQALTRGVRRGWTRSSLTLSGTLRTSAGIPAPGVAVGLFARDGRDGTRRAIGSAISDAAGHWVVTAPRGPSRTLTIAYGSGMQATVSIRQTVTPAVTLHVRPLEGARFRFSGRLLVRPLGSPPPLIVVQVRTDRRPWQLLGSAIRTSRSGRFTLTYAAGRKLAGYRFTFRALAPATGLFATGISPTTETVAR
jgi:5-hydroxyisourate hydrolase-like protein (transthyretin family)